MSTSQASLEFFSLLSLSLILLSVVFSFYLVERNSSLEEVLLLESRETAGQIAAVINQVYLGGSGYSSKIRIPEKIGSYNYSVYVSNSHIYLVLSGYPLSVSEKIIPETISGNFSSGEKTLTNLGGVVLVE